MNANKNWRKWKHEHPGYKKDYPGGRNEYQILIAVGLGSIKHKSLRRLVDRFIQAGSHEKISLLYDEADQLDAEIYRLKGQLKEAKDKLRLVAMKSIRKIQEEAALV